MQYLGFRLVEMSISREGCISITCVRSCRAVYAEARAPRYTFRVWGPFCALENSCDPQSVSDRETECEKSVELMPSRRETDEADERDAGFGCCARSAGYCALLVSPREEPKGGMGRGEIGARPRQVLVVGHEH